MITRIAACLTVGIAIAHQEIGAAVGVFVVYFWHLSNVWDAENEAEHAE